MRRPALALLALAIALGATGCGRERLAVPDVSRADIRGPGVERAFPEQGLFFEAPASLVFGKAPAPLVTQATSGSATIAVWRYERTEPLPRSDEALAAASEELASAVRQRDSSFREISREPTEVDGAPAVEIVGEGRIAGRPRAVRSTHVYAKGAEVVIDQYASPDEFEVLDEAVFAPLVESFRVDPPRR